MVREVALLTERHGQADDFFVQDAGDLEKHLINDLSLSSVRHELYRDVIFSLWAVTRFVVINLLEGHHVLKISLEYLRVFENRLLCDLLSVQFLEHVIFVASLYLFGFILKFFKQWYALLLQSIEPTKQ